MKKSQTTKLMEIFDRGESLTVGEAVVKHGIYALSQRCGNLREMKYPVESEMITLPSGARVARYRKKFKSELF